MGIVVLIRHGAVYVDSSVDPRSWELDSSGSGEIEPLRLHPWVQRTSLLASSAERKAVATAFGLKLGLPVVVRSQLGELRRPAGDWLPAQEAFRDRVRRIFANPDQGIAGCEPAVVARARLQAEIDRLAHRTLEGVACIVSHGLVLSLLLAWIDGRRCPTPEEWGAIRFPDVAVLDWARRRVIQPFGES
ncbi:MAG: phosphoglycerate mutase family protein [Chloroflexi bacterium]|nr:phosphoglycerate mutase family protein [Chloroflexota bacterium]